MDATALGKIGKYKILRVLGAGGMGEVILAEDSNLGRVAIKRPLKGADPDTLARFQVEKNAAGLIHPNIPRVYEVGEEGGLPYIAMEFVEGEALNKIIDEGRPLDLINKLEIMEQVGLALGHAHQQGIIHRDVKPANIIVQPNGIAKIIDFGIAKIEQLDGASSITKTHQLVGTLHYIAPERFKGELVDRRSDIFSAGAVLYELLTGKLLFAGGENTAFYKIVNEAHASLAEHIQGYPPALDGILERALAKDPNQRYSHAEDFSDDLHEVIEELKQNGVLERLDRAERMTMEGRFSAASDLLNEAMNLDPANTQVRKLKKFVREKQEDKKREEKIANLVQRANEAVVAENFDAALASLNDAFGANPNFPGLKQAIEAVERRKKRHDISLSALAQAEQLGNEGDFIRALQVLAIALNSDPENQGLLDAHLKMTGRSEDAARQWRVHEIFASVRTALDAKNFISIEPLLGEAERIEPGHPEVEKLRRKAIVGLEAFLIENSDRADIEELLELSRTTLATRKRDLTVERCKAEAESMFRDGRFDEAIHRLESGIRDTGDESLSKTLAMIVENRAASLRRLELLDKRVTILRGQGELEEAIQLVQEHASSTQISQGAQQLLTALIAEREQRETITGAVHAAREAAGRADFRAATDLLQSVVKVYGESPELAREFDELQRARTSVAKERVGKSIQIARQAFLKNDASGALEVLNSVAESVEYADPGTRDDWERITGSAQEAIRRNSAEIPRPATAKHEVPELNRKVTKLPMILLIVGGVCIMAVFLTIYLRSVHPSAPQQPAGANSSISTPSEARSPDAKGSSAGTGIMSAPSSVTATKSNNNDISGNQSNSASTSARDGEQDDWRRVEHSTNLTDLNQFVQKHPSGVFRAQADARREDIVWSASRAADTSATLNDYLRQYPAGRYVQSANDELAKIDMGVIRSSNDPMTLEAFLARYPAGDIHNEVVNRLDDVVWAQTAKDSAGIQAYLGKFPNGKHTSEARDRLRAAPAPGTGSSAAANSGTTTQHPQLDDKTAILNTLNSYRNAYDHQDLAAMEQIWPTMSDQQRKDTTKLFKSVKAVHLTFEVLSGPDVTGAEASLTVSQINAVSQGGEFVPHTTKAVIKLKRRNSDETGGWYIESIR